MLNDKKEKAFERKKWYIEEIKEQQKKSQWDLINELSFGKTKAINTLRTN